MQCVAQSAPLVGVGLTMLNRRNLKRWALDWRQRVHFVPSPAPAEATRGGPGPRAALGSGPANGPVPGADQHDRVSAGI